MPQVQRQRADVHRTGAARALHAYPRERGSTRSNMAGAGETDRITRPCFSLIAGESGKQRSRCSLVFVSQWARTVSGADVIRAFDAPLGPSGQFARSPSDATDPPGWHAHRSAGHRGLRG